LVGGTPTTGPVDAQPPRFVQPGKLGGCVEQFPDRRWRAVPDRDAGGLALAVVGIRFARVNVFSWSSPSPDANGAYMTFVGLEIGHRFFGMVTSQEAYIEAQAPKSRIVMP
jgi:hypothetical protein